MRAALLLAVLAAPAWAREPLDAAGFEALVEGRSLSYTREGEAEPYGVERHYEGRRVTWYLVGTGECMEGTWRAEGPKAAPRICFEYDLSPGPHCFLYFREGDAILSTNLDGGDLDVTPLGPEHEVEFGCEYLGV